MCVSVATVAGTGSPNKQFFSSEQSTQKANCYTKHAVTNRIPVRATLIRVNEVSDWNSSMKHFEWSGMAKCFREGNEMSHLLRIKTNIELFRRVQTD